MPENTARIGVISDTHGLLRPEAMQALEGCRHILHAGDVGRPEVLQALRGLAPVTAVSGNVDRGEWAEALPPSEIIELNGVSIYMLHDLHELDLNPAAAGIQVVISGHSHQPLIESRQGVLYLNPGSAGPRRFRLPVCLAYLHLHRQTPSAELITLVE